MNLVRSRADLAYWLFALGFFTSTWDTIFSFSAGGFHLKAQQVFFLLAAAVAWLGCSCPERMEFFRPLQTPFAKAIVLVWAYYVGTSPWSASPYKSLMYSSWLAFQLLAVWLTGLYLTRKQMMPRLVAIAWLTLQFNAGIILIDQVAFYFGYVGGLIGRNQDAILHWGVSRPHAFSYEPSYAAAFLSLGLITVGGHFLMSARSRFWAGLWVLAIVTATILTTSRTGWFSLGSGLVLLFAIPVLAGHRPPLRILGLTVASVLAAIAVFLASTSAHQKSIVNNLLVGGIVRGTDGSGNSRLHALLEAFRIFRETKGIGCGFGASYWYYLQHGGSDYSDPNAVALGHYGNELIMSVWGQLMAEGGIPAMLLYAAAAFFLLRDLFRRWKRDFDPLTLGALAAAGAWFGFTAFFVGNVARGDVWVWISLWGAIAYGRMAEEGRDASPS